MVRLVIRLPGASLQSTVICTALESWRNCPGGRLTMVPDGGNPSTECSSVLITSCSVKSTAVTRFSKSITSWSRPFLISLPWARRLWLVQRPSARSAPPFSMPNTAGEPESLKASTNASAAAWPIALLSERALFLSR